MAKVLFVPTNSREIAQFSLVKNELETNSDCHILAISLNKNTTEMFQQRHFSYKYLKDYQTKNILNIINREKPDIVVTDFIAWESKGFIFAANYLGAPALQIDDGLTSDYSCLRKPDVRRVFIKGVKWLMQKEKFVSFPYIFATLRATTKPPQFFRKIKEEVMAYTYIVPCYIEGLNIAVMSSFAREAYISMGVPPERLFVTGQPAFDMIWRTEFDRNRVMLELGVPDNKGIVVLATQPFVEFNFWTKKEREEFVMAVVRAMVEFSDKQLVVKLHPSEKVETYQEIFHGMDENQVIISRDVALYQLLDACDLLMTVHSTVALEAMILDKPVITINLSGKPDLFPYAESGAAIGVYTEEDIVPAIQKAMYDSAAGDELKRKRKEFVYQHAYKPDGQASKRVAELIIRLANEAEIKGGVSA